MLISELLRMNPRLLDEIQKLKIAIKYGANALMDLSVGGNLARVRREVIKRSTVPVGTVPIYEVGRLGQPKKIKIFLNLALKMSWRY